MNNYIEELAGKALDKAVPETWTTLDRNQLRKFYIEFSRLIATECINIANIEAASQKNRHGKVAADNIWFTIKNRFGVK